MKKQLLTSTYFKYKFEEYHKNALTMDHQNDVCETNEAPCISSVIKPPRSGPFTEL